MTVSELIAQLERLPPEMPVKIWSYKFARYDDVVMVHRVYYGRPMAELVAISASGPSTSE